MLVPALKLNVWEPSGTADLEHAVCGQAGIRAANRRANLAGIARARLEDVIQIGIGTGSVSSSRAAPPLVYTAASLLSVAVNRAAMPALPFSRGLDVAEGRGAGVVHVDRDIVAVESRHRSGGRDGGRFHEADVVSTAGHRQPYSRSESSVAAGLC